MIKRTGTPCKQPGSSHGHARLPTLALHPDIHTISLDKSPVLFREPTHDVDHALMYPKRAPIDIEMDLDEPRDLGVSKCLVLKRAQSAHFDGLVYKSIRRVQITLISNLMPESALEAILMIQWCSSAATDGKQL